MNDRRLPPPRGPAVRRILVAVGLCLAAVAAIWLDALAFVVGPLPLFTLGVAGLTFAATFARRPTKAPWPLIAVRVLVAPGLLGCWFSTLSANYNFSHAQVLSVAAACEEFRNAHGAYPQYLHELVPEYLRSVPKPAYPLGFGRFDDYLGDYGDGPLVLWSFGNPFRRCGYYVASHKWGGCHD